MITLEDFYMGRDVKYAAELTGELRANAQVTVLRANRLLAHFGEDRKVNSGWRPASVNAATPGAAKRSKHMLCLAIDLDDDEGDLCHWCLENLDVLAEIGLWLEHPSATKGWCHVQTVPPGNPPKPDRRVFYP